MNSREDKKIIENLSTGVKQSYIMWKDGHDLRQALPKVTFYRHRRLIIEKCGQDIKNTPPSELEEIKAKPLSEKDAGWDPEPLHKPVYPSADLKSAYRK